MTAWPRVHRWWPFVLLVLAAASRWMLAAVRPEAESTLVTKAFGCAWAALLALLLLRGNRNDWKDWRGFLAGAMLLGGPAIALLVGDRVLDSESLSLALALTPVAIAVASAALGTSSDGITGRIWPGLAAVGGLLLILPQPSLGDIRVDLLLFFAPVLTGVGAALFYADRAETPRKIAAALIGATALFTLALTTKSVIAGTKPHASLLAVSCDGILTLLMVLALSRLGATRWSAQFALVPLLILIEGMVLVRPGITTRWVVGLVLVALASVYLLLPHQDEDESSLLLL
jgi:drug/metabolite transporter (DMT)-like permease